MATVGVEQIARALNLTPRRVQQLVKDGLPQVSRGKYELGTCMHWYIRYLQAALERRSITDGDTERSLTGERIRQARETADRLAIANARTRGEIVLVGHVADVLSTLGAELASRHNAVPGRVASEFAGTTDAAVIRHRLRDELREVRDAVADSVTKLAESFGAAEDARSDSEVAAEPDGEPVGGSDKAPTRRKRRTRKVAK